MCSCVLVSNYTVFFLQEHQQMCLDLLVNMNMCLRQQQQESLYRHRRYEGHLRSHLICSLWTGFYCCVWVVKQQKAHQGMGLYWKECNLSFCFNKVVQHPVKLSSWWCDVIFWLVLIIFILSHCGISRTLNSDNHSFMYELFCYQSDLHLIKYFQILLEKGKLN